MTSTRKRLFAGAALTALLSAIPMTALGQAWPARQVRIVLPFPPGGGTDIQGRLLAKKFSESLGQSFVADNRGGAGGLIGSEIVAKAPPDGHTILFTSASLAVNSVLNKKITFDPVKDLAPVSWLSSAPLVLIVHPSVPAKNVKELIALSKREKGRLNAASNGSGTTSHLAIEMLKLYGGAEVTHVPYKGGGLSAAALLSGEVEFRFSTTVASLQHIRAGRVRALAVSTAKRSSVLPELPTLTSIYPGIEADNWYGMFVPAGTAKEIVSRLNAELIKALNSPDMRDAITRDGAEPVGSTPEELAAFFRREVEKYGKVIKAARVQVE